MTHPDYFSWLCTTFRLGGLATESDAEQDGRRVRVYEPRTQATLGYLHQDAPHWRPVLIPASLGDCVWRWCELRYAELEHFHATWPRVIPCEADEVPQPRDLLRPLPSLEDVAARAAGDGWQEKAAEGLLADLRPSPGPFGGPMAGGAK